MKLILSSNLSGLLKKRGMTPSQLARATGVPNSTIQNWLSGQEPRNLLHLKKISNYLGTSLDFLLFGSEGDVQKEDSIFSKFNNEINAGTFEVILRKKN